MYEVLWHENLEQREMESHTQLRNTLMARKKELYEFVFASFSTEYQYTKLCVKIWK